MKFKILKKLKRSRARTGIIETGHGKIETPYFIPVATAATVRGLDQQDLKTLGAQVTLANTYHLHLKPGEKIVKKLGGLHKFMNFDRPIFTDSGGFQAFSLGYGMEHNIGKIAGFFPGDYDVNSMAKQKKLATIDDSGVTFKAHDTGRTIHLNPKISMQIQNDLGADIILAFDECTSPLSDYDYTKRSLERTHKWAIECKKLHKNKKQALYGITQGGEYKDLRHESTKFITALDFEGIAIGGSLGKTKDDMHKVLDWSMPLLPEDKPVHLLGIGGIDDLFECVERGIDTFDCVAPTRIGRRGALFIAPKSGGTLLNKFRINIENVKFQLDKKPIDPNCGCYTCKHYSRAYVNHLFRAKESAYFRLASMHNIHFMLRLMEKIRNSINDNTFLKLKKEWLK